MKISIFFDGAVSESKKGCDMGIGLAVFVDGIYEDDLSKFIYYPGYNTSDQHCSSSNVAEWLGCLNAFILAKEYMQPGDEIEIYSDSQLITNQYNEQFQINNLHFKELYEQAKNWANLAKLTDLQIKWVPREQNREADKLSKVAVKGKKSNVDYVI